MIEKLTSAFDWVYDMPIESQSHFAIGLSFVGFVVAAAVRETVKHSGLRYLARAIGAGSFFAVAAFAHHVAHESEKLNSELMVRQQQKGSHIGSETAVTLISKRGYKVTIGEDNGVRRVGAELREHDGRFRHGDGVRERTMVELPTGTVCDHGGYGGRNDGLHALAGLFERAKQYAVGSSDDARAFQLPRKVEGESF